MTEDELNDITNRKTRAVEVRKYITKLSEFVSNCEEFPYISVSAEIFGVPIPGSIVDAADIAVAALKYYEEEYKSI